MLTRLPSVWLTKSYVVQGTNRMLNSLPRYSLATTQVPETRHVQLGSVQRRAVQIVAGNTSYTEASSTLGIQSLADRRSELCRTLFTEIVNNESHSLHYLLPVKRDTQLIGRLRSATAYPTFRVRTNRFKNSFIPFCLSNYQWHLWYFNLLCVFFLCLIVNLCVCYYPAYGYQKPINVCMYVSHYCLLHCPSRSC